MALNLVKQVFLDPKTFYHQCDGTGRDTYIHYTNGGLLSQDKLHNLKLKSKDNFIQQNFTKPSYQKKSNHPPMENKLNHYPPNGTGRDTYIIINEGGRGHNWSYKNQTDNLFNSLLRSYQKLPQIPFSQSTRNSGNQFRYISEKDILRNKQLSYSQNSLSRKLSQPKFQNLKKKQTLPYLEPLKKSQSLEVLRNPYIKL